MAVLVWIEVNDGQGMYNNATDIYKALTDWRGGLYLNPQKGLK